MRGNIEARVRERFSVFEKMRNAHPFCANSHPVTKEQLTLALGAECEHNHVVFVDGRFCPHLSDYTALDGMEITSLPCKEEFLGIPGQEESLLRLRPGLSLSQPLHILYVATQSASLTVPRLRLHLGEGSAIQCVLVCAAPPEALIAPILDFQIEKAARVRLTSRFSSFDVVLHIQAVLHQEASFHSTCQQAVSFQQYHVLLQGEGASADLRGLSVLEGIESDSISTHIEHLAPYTRSTQLFKALLQGSSRAEFEGTLYIRPGAQKADASQLHRAVLLSPQARVRTQPKLEIEADDVSASHGASIAAWDEEALLYLRTRGLSEKEASQLLMRGFCQEEPAV